MRPPRDARLLHPDGTETPLELVYRGLDTEEGLHVWDATAAVYRDGDQLRVAELPARTTIVVRKAPPE